MQKLAMLALFYTALIAYSQAQKPAPSSPVLSKESLLKDPNIVWVGESQDLIILDVENNSMVEDTNYLKSVGLPNQRRVKCAPLKNQLSRKNTIVYPEESQLIYNMLKDDNLNKITVYEDMACTKAVKNPHQRYNTIIDTVITFDPNTFEEVLQVVTNQLDYRLIKSYKVHQLFYFDQKANAFGSLPLAFSPMVEAFDDNGNSLGIYREMFWIKIQHLPKPADLNNANINWARQTQRHFFPKELKPLKETKSLNDCFGMHLAQIRKNYQTEDIRGTMGYGEKVDKETVKNLGISVDSIITFDPKTFEKTTTVVKAEVAPEHLNSLRFIQEWYWDDKSKKMSVHNVFYAPIINRYDDKGNFLNSGPMFYKPSK